MDAELRRRIDELERQLIEALAKVATICERLDQKLGTPMPRDTGPFTYLSGRWKSRDGTMFGR